MNHIGRRHFPGCGESCLTSRRSQVRVLHCPPSPNIPAKRNYSQFVNNSGEKPAIEFRASVVTSFRGKLGSKAPKIWVCGYGLMYLHLGEIDSSARYHLASSHDLCPRYLCSRNDPGGSLCGVPNTATRSFPCLAVPFGKAFLFLVKVAAARGLVEQDHSVRDSRRDGIKFAWRIEPQGR